jgi:alpha-beta hydrolase superfamily lysophospholipase
MNASQQTTMQTRDGLTLPVTTWDVAGPCKGTVLIVHGLGEHCARYAHVAQRLGEAGWRTVAYDQRGHGKADGRRGDVADSTSLLDDLAMMIDTVRAKHGAPLILLGHSMGGAVVSRFVLDRGPWWRAVEGMMLSSPALAAPLNAAQKFLLRFAPKLIPHVPVDNGVNTPFVSRNPDIVAAYKADPLVHRKLSPLLAKFIIDSGEWVRANAATLSVPSLLMYAGEDHLVAPQGSAAFAANAPAQWLTYHCFTHMYHEIFNEPDRDAPLAMMCEWLNQKAAA